MFLWAKTGSMTFALSADGDNLVARVKAYGAVGHRIFVINTSHTYTSAGDGYGYSFSFMPELVYDTVGQANYTIRQNGQCYPN